MSSDMLSAYEGEQGGLRLIRAARDLDPRQTEHIGEALRSSGIPALVLWGDHDDFLPVGVGVAAEKSRRSRPQRRIFAIE